MVYIPYINLPLEGFIMIIFSIVCFITGILLHKVGNIAKKRMEDIAMAKLMCGIDMMCKRPFANMDGVNVYESTDMVLAQCGTRHGAFIAKMISGETAIFVSSEIKNGPASVLNAILSHEVGHYKYGHLNCGAIGMFVNDQFEMEADAHASMNGHDIKGALLWCCKKDPIFAIPGLLKGRRLTVKEIILSYVGGAV